MRANLYNIFSPLVVRQSKVRMRIVNIGLDLKVKIHAHLRIAGSTVTRQM